MEPRIHHLALRTRRPSATEAFYVSVLGLPVLRRDAARGSVWLAAAGVVLMVEPAGPDEPGPPPGGLDLIAFGVDGLEAWRGRLAAAGIPIEAETAYTLYFRDPDGRRVGVSTYPT